MSPGADAGPGAPHGVLAGLRVVELAGVLAGPSAGQFLAELGAEVVKIEPPGGDVTRRWRVPGETPRGDVTDYFAACNWGKETITLDLTTPDGQACLHERTDQADVVLAAYRPGQPEKLGADAATLQKRNPRLIYVHLTGYGARDARAGYDAVVQAESGFMAMNGHADGPPTKMPVALVDMLAAHQMKEAVLVGLLARQQTGSGGTYAISLMASAAAALVNQGTGWLGSGRVPQRMGSAHPQIAPYGTPYVTSDGHVVLAVGTDAQFARLCELLGLDETATDLRFATNAARVAHRAALDARLEPALARWRRDDLLEKLDAARIPAGAVHTLDEALAHPEAARLVLRDGAGTPGLRQAVFAEPLALAPPPRQAPLAT